MCWLALGMRVNPDTRTIITNFKYFTYAAQQSHVLTDGLLCKLCKPRSGSKGAQGQCWKQPSDVLKRKRLLRKSTQVVYTPPTLIRKGCCYVYCTIPMDAKPQWLQSFQIKPSVKSCDCQAAYVKYVRFVISVVVAPDLQHLQNNLGKGKRHNAVCDIPALNKISKQSSICQDQPTA